MGLFTKKEGVLMYRKFKNLVCHPSCLGMYFLDHWYSIVGWWLFFFIFTCVILAISDLGRKRPFNNIAQDISNKLVYSGYIDDASYKDNMLDGKYIRIETDYALISFNDNAFMNNINYDGMILVFGKENVNAFYRTIHLGSKSYKDLEINDFSIEEIKDGNIRMRMSFEAFMLAGFQAGEDNYKAVCYFEDLFNILLYYLIALVICYVAGWLTNPPIERRFRIKIVAYSTMVYFVLAWLTIMMNVAWLLYLGMGFALIYTIFAFSRIRQVRIERRK